MQLIRLNNVSYQHQDSTETVFEELTLSINTRWKTGLVGRNGRGKTTLLHLINKNIVPRKGSIESSLPTAIFPSLIKDQNQTLFSVIKRQVAPFEQWETEMEQLLNNGSKESLETYHDVFQLFITNNGFEIDSMIARECSEIGLDERLFTQPFITLSGGEQTRGMIAAVFLNNNIFPLLDEPTNHLDMDGREILGSYLQRKNGFIIVSHDRHFLDHCCDHIVAINKNDVRVFQGNFTTWKQQMRLEEETESTTALRLEKEITSLEIEAQQRRSWSLVTEKEKTKAFDSGFVSHKAAKMMKRALAAERRIEERIDIKKSLLKNKETIRSMSFHPLDKSPEILVSVENATIGIDDKVLLKDISLTVRRGERVAILGLNGSGKTTILNLIRGVLKPIEGICYIPHNVQIVHGYQIPLWNKGMLRDILQNEKIDESQFRTVMGAFNVQGDIFDRPLETFSYGERKKVDLCRSFLFPHHLLVWDEPVNYIDIESREQIEEAIHAQQPTMLFVEHDRTFVEKIATRIIHIP